MVTATSLRKIVGTVMDPELPPVTIEDLGILREIEVVDGTVIVTVTPTYSGCPAVEVIEDDIRGALAGAGYHHVQIIRAFSPAWTTDWISDDGRRKLTEAGIAPPEPRHGRGPDLATAVSLGRKHPTPVPCPRCAGSDTTQISPFGSTACKSLYRCNDCSEPFDYFKGI